MTTIKNITAVVLLFSAALFISSCTGESENTGTPSTAAKESAAVTDSAKQPVVTDANASANEQFTYQLITSENNTWGYDIYSGEKLMIHQPNIPGMPGNEGFKTKEDAGKVAEMVMGKIKNGEMPPTVTGEEMKKLNIKL